MEEAAFQDPAQILRSKPKKPLKWVVLSLIVVILALGIFFGAKTLGKTQKKEVVPTPTPTQNLFPTDTPTPEESGTPTPKVTSTPTPKPTTNPVDKATGLDRSELTVEIQNGSGTVGAASKFSDFIKGFGYHVVSVGNADNFNYENITISVKSDFAKYLPLLKKDVSSSYTVTTANSTLSASSSADAVLIIGK